MVARSRVKVYGYAQPRLFTPELEPLTPRNSDGFAVIEFARDVLQTPLTPWQEFVAIHALETFDDGEYRFKVVLVVVSRQNGKTTLDDVVTLWKMYMKPDVRTVLGSAQTLDKARIIEQGLIGTIRGNEELEAELHDVKLRLGDEHFIAGPNPCVYRIAATNENAGRSLSVDHLRMDELRTHKDQKAWAAMSKTTMARPNAQTWALSNAGDSTSVVLNNLQDKARAAIAGGETNEDTSVGLFEYSAPDGCDLDDIESIQQSNPNLGYTISIHDIYAAMESDTPETFRTEVLCQRVISLSGAFDLEAWKECNDPVPMPHNLRDSVALVVDAALDGSHVTLTAAVELTDGKVRVEPVAAWSNTDLARRDLSGWITRVKPMVLGYYAAGPCAVLSTDLEIVARKLGIDCVPIAQQEAVTSCMELCDLVKGRKIRHTGDPMQDAHVAAAQVLRVGDGYRYTRKNAGSVDAAYAAAGAVRLARSYQPALKPESFVV